jgi:hypothetical protein
MHLDLVLFQAEGEPCKKNGNCFKERSNLKNSETTKGRWLAEESCYQPQFFANHVNLGVFNHSY